MKLSTQTRFFLITIITVLAVYTPSSLIGTMGMDDYELIDLLERMSVDIDLWGLFLRDKSTVYYRPLLTVINLVDYKIWGLSLPGFHLTNYIFHVANSVLVFSIVIKLFSHQLKPYVPATISTLIFALNPLTCESVSWISGRSDIFGTFFSLLATRSFLMGSFWRYILTPFLIFLGICCKENAFAIIPVLLILQLILHFDGLNPDSNHIVNLTNIMDGTKKIGVWCVFLSIPVIIYVGFRTWGGGSFDVDIQRITAAGSRSTESLGYNFSGYIRVFPAMAFYLKKLMVPYPLNFSISSINNGLYMIIFIGFIGANTYLWLKRHYVLPIITTLLIVSFLPALPIAIGGVAWTPFAERYLYLALCVWGTAVAFLYSSFLSRRMVKPFVLNAILVFLIMSSAFGTIMRQMDWKSNETILADTVTKISSDNYRAMLNYALSHGRKDRILYLRKAEEAAKDSHDKQWRAKLYLSIAEYYGTYDNEPFRMSDSDPDADGNADDYISPEMSEKDSISQVFVYIDKGLQQSRRPEILASAVSIVSQLSPHDTTIQKETIERSKAYYTELCNIKLDSFYMYRIGNLEERMKHWDAATKAYKTVLTKFPNSEYAKFASIRLKKIKNKDCNSEPNL